MRSVVAGRMVTEGRGVVRHLAGCPGHRVVRLSSLFERLPVGVVGCSVLYHLVKHGWKDVALIERSELAARRPPDRDVRALVDFLKRPWAGEIIGAARLSS